MTSPWFAKLPMLLVFPPLVSVAAACGGQAPPAQQAQAPAAARPEPDSPAIDEPSSPAETLAQADLAYESQLGASRGQFDVERQVTVLREAVLLYSQFLERADGQPELQPAVRKSRERIADAKATIVFLLASLKADGEPPPAPTE